MTAPWRLAVVILAAVYFAEGFNIFLVGKIAPAMADALDVRASALAPVFFAQQAGLAAGAMIGGAVADRLGRQPVLILLLVLAAMATFASPFASDIATMALVRGLCGLVLGGGGPIVLALVVQAAPPHSRNAALTGVLAGYSLGAAFGSLAVWAVLDRYGWEPTFGLGAAMLLIGALAVAIVVRPAPAVAGAARTPLATLVRGSLRWTTVVLGLCFLLSMGVVALVAGWTPTYFHDLALVRLADFSVVGALAGPAAIVGMLGTGWLASRVGPRRLTLSIFGTHAVALAGLGVVAFVHPGFGLVFFTAMTAQSAGQGLLNITIAERYPEALRATAFGAAAGAGRLGGLASLWLGAFALDLNLPLSSIFGGAAVITLVVGGLILAISNRGEAVRL